MDRKHGKHDQRVGICAILTHILDRLAFGLAGQIGLASVDGGYMVNVA